MMKRQIDLEWSSGLDFVVTQSGGELVLTADEDETGRPKGLRPKALMLSALAGCTAMDVASLFRKMRAAPEAFRIEVSARLTEEHPKVYDRVRLDYYFYGTNLKKEKLLRCVDLSIKRYCGVSAMFEKFAELTKEVHFLEGK